MTATACLRFQLLILIFNDHLKTLCNNKDRTTKHNLSLVKCSPEVKKLLRNTGLPVLLGTLNLVLASTWNHRVVIQRSVSQNTCFSLCKLVLARGGDSDMKLTGMLVVSLRGVNCRFWSRFGVSGRKAKIFTHTGIA